MPPGRPRGRPAKNATSSTANAATPQSRLSFGPKNATNKITKPSAPPSQSSKDKKPSPKQKSAIADVTTAPKQADLSAPSEDDSQQTKPATSRSSPASSSAEEEEPSGGGGGSSSQKNLPIRGGSSSQGDLANASKLGPKDSREVEATKVSEAQIKKYWRHKEDDRIAPRVHQRGLGVHEKVLREFDLSSQFGPCIGIPRMKRWKRADGLGLKPPLEVLAVLMKEEGLERAYVDELMGKTLGALEA